MQRRLRIALAVTAAAGAALLGTGTAFADSFTDILGGSDASQVTPSDYQGTDADSDADSDDSDSDSSDSTDASSSSSDDDNSSSDDSGSDDN